jgi:translation initiation factor 1
MPVAVLQTVMARQREPDTRLVYSTERPLPAAQPPAPEPARPAGKGIRLRLERRASGRVVTVVTGLPGTSAEIEALGRELRAACGTGGTARAGTFELQGDQREKVERFLAARGLRSKRAGG